jgi:hypothetical protein
MLTSTVLPKMFLGDLTLGKPPGDLSLARFYT